MALKVNGIATIITEVESNTWQAKTSGKQWMGLKFKLSTDREFMRFNRGETDIFSADMALPADSPLIPKIQMGAVVWVDGELLVNEWETKEGEKRRMNKIQIEGLTFVGETESFVSVDTSTTKSDVTDTDDDIPF